MKKYSFVLMLIVLTMAGCRSAANRNKAAAETVRQEEAMIVPVEKATLLPSEAGVVNLVLRDGSCDVTIRKQERKAVYAEFTADGYARLHAVIAPVGTSTANLRINTITLPDGSTDGPFGRELDYDIPASGKIRLEIGESNMQGDAWGGDFTLDVKLTKQARIR